MKAGLLALVTLVVGVIIGTAGLQRFTAAGQNTPSPTSAPMPTSIVVRTGPTVIKALQTQAKLETVVMKMAKDTTIKREQGTLNRCGQEITYLGYYDVTAGVDLSKITQANINAVNDGQLDTAIVSVILPKAEIMHNVLDMKNSRIVAKDVPSVALKCDDMLGDMTGEAQQKLSDAVQQDAVEQGILRQAEDQAKFVVERILLETGYKKVTVQIAK